MCQSQLPFARYNRSIASAPLGVKLRFAETTLPHHADADEVSVDDELSYDELKGDLLTIGWNNHLMTALEVVDMNGDRTDGDNDDDEEGYDADDEVRGIRARFYAMTLREQNRFIAKTKLRICSMIGANSFDWEPSDEFILEIIEDETPEDAIFEMARAAYLAAPLPPEDNPSDEEPSEDESADKIRIGQSSKERGLPNIGWRDLPSWIERRDHRRGPRRMKSRRPKSHGFNCESHCPKYGRQDWRHQAPRIEAKYERRFAAYEAEREALFREMGSWELAEDEVRNETNFTEAEMEALNERFGFSEDHLFFQDLDERWKMEEMARDFGYVVDVCDVAGLPGYMPGDFERRGYYGPDRLHEHFDFDYDPYDDYAYYADPYDDGCDDDPVPCACDLCSGEGEYRRRFGDWDDDDMGIFDEYGQSEADIDAMIIGQMSNKRRTYHIQEMMERRPTLV